MLRRWWFWGCLVAPVVALALAVLAFEVFCIQRHVHVDYKNHSRTWDGRNVVCERVYVRTKEFLEASTSTARYSVMIEPVDGGGARVLVDNAWNPGCAPRSPLVAYVTGARPDDWPGKADELWILDLKTRKKWRLSGSLGEKNGTVFCWSPSGDEILYHDRSGACFLGDPWGKERVDVFTKVSLPPGGFQVMKWFARWGQDGLIHLKMAIQARGKPFETRIYDVDPRTWTVKETSQ
jgi:hypothetical protein